jgi:hypothetical protein
MTKVKVLEKVKLKGQRLEGQGHDIKWKVLPEEIQMWNMKALASTNQKFITMVRVCWRKDGQTDGQRDYYRAPTISGALIGGSLLRVLNGSSLGVCTICDGLVNPSAVISLISVYVIQMLIDTFIFFHCSFNFLLKNI